MPFTPCPTLQAFGGFVAELRDSKAVPSAAAEDLVLELVDSLNR
jgi:hypothetical protein